jgi:rRNA maturation RNase YbeY
MSVFFSNADIDFSFDKKETIKKWIAEIISRHGKKLGKISYLFCSDEMIYDYNVRFLNHDSYTDIITFDFVEGNLVSGDIIISVDRVGENANSFSASFESELHRVIIHGVLHLLGFKDKSPDDAAMMRQKENESLQILDSLLN